MQATERVPVLVVGGGPVGAALALELAQRGVEVLVLEAYQQPQQVPKGQNLTPRTMEHFRSWQIEDELRAAQTIPAEMGQGGLTAYGTLVHGRTHDWLRRDMVIPFYHARNARLPQYATEAVLRRRIAELPKVQFLTGWRVTSVEQDDAEVRVTAVDVATGAIRQFAAQWLVGCDGGKSVVRQSAAIGQSLEDHDRTMALVVFRSPAFDRLLERFPGKSFFNVLHPDFGGYWQFFGRVDTDATFFFHAPAPRPGELAEAEILAMLARAAGEPFAATITYAGSWDLRFAIADRYRSGRILIAGDAAHSHPPYGGYGINTGFEDARNLGWKLAARVQGWGGEALLDSYDAERRPVFVSTARDFIAKSIENDRLFLEQHGANPEPGGPDDALGAREQHARDEVLAYAPQYSGSPIVSGCVGKQTSAMGTHEHAARAGHHLPDAALADGSRLVDRLGTGFTLLTGDAELAQAFADAAEASGIPFTVIVGHAASLECETVLVRPDGYVGWTGNNQTAPHEAAAIMARCCPVEGAVAAAVSV